MLVICAGMLRAGSTFQYNLVSFLLEGAQIGIRHGQFDLKGEWLSNPQLAAWANDRERHHIIKNHMDECLTIGRRELEMIEKGIVRICYIHRDIRDVAASAKEVWGLKGSQLLEKLDGAVKAYEMLHTTPGVLRQKYEEVTSDVPKAVKEIARFLEVTPTQVTIDEVVRGCSLQAMETFSRSSRFVVYHAIRNALVQTLPATQRLRWPRFLVPLRFDQRTLVGGKHISSTRGAAGAWRNKLTGEEQEALTTRYEGYLMRAGYSVLET